MGDAAGIGPEVILKALDNNEARAAANYLVYGSPEVMERAATFVNWKGHVRGVANPAECLFRDNEIEVITCRTIGMEDCKTGEISAACGDLAFQSIRRAIEDAQAGLIDATATAPINKDALSRAGHKFAGHTDRKSVV